MNQPHGRYAPLAGRATYHLPPACALVLRTSDPAGRGHGGFQWPSLGPIAAPDWDAEADHGGGLWGLLWGHGDPRHLRHAETRGAVWQVVEVPAETILFKHGKVKYPAGQVVCASRSRRTAVAFLNRHNPEQVPRLARPQVNVGQWVPYTAIATALVLVLGARFDLLGWRDLALVAFLGVLAIAFLQTLAGHGPRGAVTGPVTWLPKPQDVGTEAEAWLADQQHRGGVDHA